MLSKKKSPIKKRKSSPIKKRKSSLIKKRKSSLIKKRKSSSIKKRKRKSKRNRDDGCFESFFNLFRTRVIPVNNNPQEDSVLSRNDNRLVPSSVNVTNINDDRSSANAERSERNLPSSSISPNQGT